MIKPWKKVSSKPAGDFRIFKIRSDTCVNPRTGKEHDFYVLDSVNWVNVIAITPDQKLVMVQTIEEKMEEMKARKRQLAESLFDADGAPTLAMTEADIDLLFS